MLRLLPYLPQRLAFAVAKLPREVSDSVTELRLRAGGPVSLTVGGKNRCFNACGRFCPVGQGLSCSEEELKECLTLLSRASLYSFGDSIKQGFLPFADGCRAGVCGEGIVRDGVLAGFSRVYGISLRLKRFIGDFGFEAARRITEKGLRGALIYSPPNCGKTTLLKSIALLLGNGSMGRAYKVAIADERCELFVPELRSGLVDALCGVKKSTAIELLCRSMSPQVLICDELSAEDGAALGQVLGMGVAVVAGIHADTAEGLCRRPFAAELLRRGVFPLLIGLNERYEYNVEEYK
ncbi:MAG: hypothetical protein IJB65_05365 [Clostridia bacterium]|nr:hypothetical protein [Clostridia bacterium]